MIRNGVLLGCLLSSAFVTGTAWGQESAVRFPRASASWVNSAPITEDMLKGKAAILYYYEES